MELQLSSVKRNIRRNCEDKSAFFVNAASLYVVDLNELESSLGIRMDAL